MQSCIHNIEAISEIMIPKRQMSNASFSGDGGGGGGVRVLRLTNS